MKIESNVHCMRQLILKDIKVMEKHIMVIKTKQFKWDTKKIYLKKCRSFLKQIRDLYQNSKSQIPAKSFIIHLQELFIEMNELMLELQKNYRFRCGCSNEDCGACGLKKENIFQYHYHYFYLNFFLQNHHKPKFLV